MQRTMLHAKIHRARVTETSLDYVGSITVDPDLLERAGILNHEMVLVSHLANSSRFETYAIEGTRSSGEICLNGAAAHLASVGDLVIIMAFAVVDDSQAQTLKPKIVLVDDNNRPLD